MAKTPDKTPDKTVKQDGADAAPQSQEPVQSGDTGSPPAPAKQTDAEGGEATASKATEEGAKPEAVEAGWQDHFGLTDAHIAGLEKLSSRAGYDIAPSWVYSATRRDSYGEHRIFPAGMDGFVRHKNGPAVFSIQDGYIVAVYGERAAQDHIGEDQVLVVG